MNPVIFTMSSESVMTSPKGLIWNPRKKKKKYSALEIEKINRKVDLLGVPGYQKKKATAGHARLLSSVAEVSTTAQQGKSNLLPIHSSAVQMKTAD